MVSAPICTSSFGWMMITSGDGDTLSRFFASGTGGGFNSDVRIMKMMSRTSSTSVKGVMLMVDITSSSGADPISAMLFARSLLRHEADVVVTCLARSVEDLDDRVVLGVHVGDQRDVLQVPLCRVGLVVGHGGGHRVVHAVHRRRVTIDEDAVLRRHLHLDVEEQ